MVGRVGNDSFGPVLIENLRQNGVDTADVQTDPASATGTAIIVVDANGQNSIVLSPGGNGKVTPADLERVSFADSNLLLLQLEIPVEAVLAAARLAKEHGLRVLLNPAPARSLPEELLSLPDFLVPNESELSLLTGLPVNDIPSAEKAARVLLERGIQTVIVTLGANGALVVTKELTEHVPSFQVDVVDTTAAGDAFIGGFAARLLESDGALSAQEQARALQDAVRYGCACGALAATKFGAQPSLPTKEDVERFMSSREGA
jgi:ribokinase